MAWSHLSLTQSHLLQANSSKTQPFDVDWVYHCIEWDFCELQYLVRDSIETNGCE